MTLLANYFFINMLFFILVLSWCKVTFVGAIKRHIIILDCKRFTAYIIFFDTEAP